MVSASNNLGNGLLQPASSDDRTAIVRSSMPPLDNGAADSPPATATINITPVNDAPSGTDKTITLSVGDSNTFSKDDFGFSDAHDNPANNSRKSVINHETAG